MSELTPRRRQALQIIDRHARAGVCVSQRELAAELGVSGARAGQIVRALVDGGYAERGAAGAHRTLLLPTRTVDGLPIIYAKKTGPKLEGPEGLDLGPYLGEACAVPGWAWREARLRAGLSGSEAAARLGVNVRSLWRWEREGSPIGRWGSFVALHG